MSLFLLGPPGSGKGTYGKLLSQALSIPLLTASDILKSDKEFTENFIKKGKLGPDDVVESSVRSFLHDGGYGMHTLTEKGWFAKTYILDGYPRTPGQYNMMAKWSPLIKPPAVAVHINLPKEICKKKIMGRVQCVECEGVYNLEEHIDEEKGWCLPAIFPDRKKCFCDACGAFNKATWAGKYNEKWMKRRSDDVNEDVVEGRLREYEDVTAKILNEVEERGERIVEFVPKKGLDSFDVLLAGVKEALEDVDEDDFV